MRYYKLIRNGTFIGVGTSLDFRRYQAKHGILLCCDENDGEYIFCADALYHDEWMAPRKTDTIHYESAHVIEIDSTEYDTLYEAIETGDEIDIIETDSEDHIDEPVIDEDTTVTLEAYKEMKNQEMNYICRMLIEAGFDIVLSDGELHHFSLTTQDQLNLITLSTMIATGVEYVPYHADGELCTYFSSADMQNVIQAATEFKVYHTTYVNALKNYISHLSNIEEISAIQYGDELPDEYQTDVLRNLISQRDGE